MYYFDKLCKVWKRRWQLPLKRPRQLVKATVQPVLATKAAVKVPRRYDIWSWGSKSNGT